MVSRKIKIENPTGFYAGTAGALCKAAVRFRSTITFQNQEGISNAKSMLSILGSGVKYGDEIELFCEGPDEQKALEHLVSLIQLGLEE